MLYKYRHTTDSTVCNNVCYKILLKMIENIKLRSRVCFDLIEVQNFRAHYLKIME